MGPCLIFVFYTNGSSDKYDTVLLRNTKRRVETKSTQNARRRSSRLTADVALDSPPNF